MFSAQELGRDETTGLYTNTQPILAQIAAMVRLLNDPTKGIDVHVGAHFGPGFPSKDKGYVPEDNATNCDINSDGKVDFNTDPEKTCAANCSLDLECSEYSNFLSQSAFVIDITGPDPVTGFPIKGWRGVMATLIDSTWFISPASFTPNV